MIELYFLSILDNIRIPACVFLGISAIIILICILMYAICTGDIDESKTKEVCTLIIKKCTWVLIPCYIIMSFVPTTKEGYMIFGMGTVIDYIQNSEEIQQLPDKAVQALNLFIDEYIEEQPQKSQQ